MISELCYWLQKTFFASKGTKYSTKYPTPGATFRHLDPKSVRRRSLGAARSGCRSQPGDLQRIRRRPVHLRPGIRGRQRGPPATGTKKRTPESVCSLPHVSAARPHPQPLQKKYAGAPCALRSSRRLPGGNRSLYRHRPGYCSRPATHNGPHHHGTPPAGKRSAGRTAVRATPRRYGCRRSGRGFPVHHPCRGSPTGDSTAYRPAPS